MKFKNKFIIIALCLLIVFPNMGYIGYNSTITVEAHSGRTDSSGGHKDNKNKSGLGSYHYHCGGHPPHLHDGGCPYSSNNNTKNSNSSSKTKKSNKSNKEVVKKVQQALNDKGYDCGEVDGMIGNKTKNSIRKFQKDNNLTVDGMIGKQLKEALDIS